MIENINTFNRRNQVLIAGIRDCYKMKQSHKFLFFLLFALITFNFVSNIYALDLPHPPNTELIEGGTCQYRSLLTQGKVLQFYRRELVRKGWKITDIPLQQTSGFAFPNRTFNFVKDKDTLTLTFSPFIAEGFVFYTIGMGESSEVGELVEAGELSSDNVFKEPESLDFMPAYPGSEQIDSRETSTGTYVGYMANGGIDEVKEFYLQGMPRYGWSLASQERIDEKETGASVKMSGVTLEFKQADKTCSVTVSKIGNVSSGVRGLTSSGLGDTIITIVYDDK